MATVGFRSIHQMVPDVSRETSNHHEELVGECALEHIAYLNNVCANAVAEPLQEDIDEDVVCAAKMILGGSWFSK